MSGPPPPPPSSSLCSSPTAALLFFSSDASTACAAALLLMVITVHVGHRVERPARNALRVLVPLFAIIGLTLYFTGTFGIVSRVQDILQAEETSLRSASGIAEFCRELQKVAQQQYWQVLLLISALYLTLQAFCIPGTVVLNAAVGAVMGTLLGVPYCTLLGTLGAICCFVLSRAVGTTLVEAADARLMKGRGLATIRGQVTRHRADLFVYIVFVRLTPILPNWLVNLASPVVGVPLHTFGAATMVGILPQTYLSVRFGSLAHLAKAGETRRIVTPWDTLLLAVIGVGVLAGLRLKKKFAQDRRENGISSVERPTYTTTSSAAAVRVPPPA